MKSLQLDVVATRGSIIESRHHVHAAVVDARGCLVAGAGEPTMLTHSRSCAKPFQVMPLLESGGFDDLHWGDDQLALACGSHGDRKSTRLNSSHANISYAVFCLKKKKTA